MSNFSGGGCDGDVNWLTDGHQFKPVGVKMNVIVKETGGTGGSAKLQQLELTLSAKIFNQPIPCDTNILYCGDAYMRTNLPFKITTNAPDGCTPEGTWLTDILVFKPVDPDAALLPLTPNGDGTEFDCSFQIMFSLMVMAMSQPQSHPGPVGLVTSPTNVCNQTAIMRGWFSNGQEMSSLHGTQTSLFPYPT